MSKNPNLKSNKWTVGPTCSIIDKKISFKNPIKTKGMINLGWTFDSLDAKNKKMGKFDEKLKEKVDKELNLLLQSFEDIKK